MGAFSKHASIVDIIENVLLRIKYSLIIRFRILLDYIRLVMVG